MKKYSVFGWNPVKKSVRHAVVLAVGGKAVPQTGSTGDGYPWAEKAGHTITELIPDRSPFVIK